MSDANEKPEISSYEKGINNLLNDMEKYEALIWAYVLRVNSNFHSNEFPTTQITKIIMAKLGLEKTKFSLFHKVIRIILNKWEETGICELVSNSQKKNARKTKEVYRFNDDGLEKIKARFIDKCIEDIIENVDVEKDLQVLKTRDKIIEDLMFKFKQV
ncbi:MAG TPA: hypothetical protein VKM55_09770 [Candidatus Lokiarchaeia archaeon]|nr:hypothetical protein [Candidatus Lokiarchaeia archaeon]